MTEPRFIQIHWLASYPGTLLNRDDAGLAKVLPFGGAIRTRISSQCLKRNWRKADDAMNIGLIENIETAARSREHIEREVTKGLAEETGKSADIISAVGLAFVEALYGEKAKDRKNRQALLLGWPEIRYMRAEARRIVEESDSRENAEARCKDYFGKEGIRRVFRAIRTQSAASAGFEAALFGRMVTSDPEANIDASLHVAHAITVHRAEKELDFLTVVDDLRAADDQAGAAGVFDAELTSGLYYGYAVVDVPVLVSNLTGVPAKDWRAEETDRRLAGEVASRLIHLIATVTPGAKKGSTAPYTYAETVLLEVGSRQPRTLSNAFRKPVDLVGDVKENALQAMRTHLAGFDQAYGRHEIRAGFDLTSGGELLREMEASPKSLGELSLWIKAVILAGQA